MFSSNINAENIVFEENISKINKYIRTLKRYLNLVFIFVAEFWNWRAERVSCPSCNIFRILCVGPLDNARHRRKYTYIY